MKREHKLSYFYIFSLFFCGINYRLESVYFKYIVAHALATLFSIVANWEVESCIYPHA